MSKEWVNYAGEIQRGKPKDGQKQGDLYIKVKKDFTVKAGSTIRMVSLEDEIGGLLERGKINEAEAEKRLENQKFVKYVLHVPPAKE